MADFANILFAGPCNRACPFCIGLEMPGRVNVDNLDRYPLLGQDELVEEVTRRGIRQVVMTGTTTDPQLYRHEERLLDDLRARLHPDTRFSVHTNGALALRKLSAFNAYDRACLSLPSFEPATYEKLMGSRRVPDLERILAAARIPVKVSCVVNEHNVGEIDAFVRRCRALGVQRLVLRRLYGETRRWRLVEDLPLVGSFRGNPVRDCDGMEVTDWDFDATEMDSVNLFADGTIGTSYLLARTPELAAAP